MTMPSREAVAEAAAWITRLHGSRRSPNVEAAFREWLVAKDEHARAFEGMTEIWDTTPALSEGELSRRARWDAPRRSRPWALAAGVLVTCALGIGAGYSVLRDPGYSTEIGEQRIVNLQDGTRVFLNAATRLAVHYDESERRIVLKEGEAFFEVAPHAARPFVVMAGGHRVTALGTAFSVRYDRSRTAVILVEGKVAVASDRPLAKPVELEPGQRLVEESGAAPKIDRPRVEAVTAWRRGEVIMDEMRLADAAAEMNRYDKARLVIDSPAIAQLPVSGIYRTGDNPGFAHIVAEMYGLSVTKEDGRIRLDLKSY